MSGDLLFPFPEPTFIFVHDVALIDESELANPLNEKGKVTYNYDLLHDQAFLAQRSVKGYLTAPNVARDFSGYTQRQKVTAVVLVPLGTMVDDTYLVHCEDQQVHPSLRGTYHIDTVRPTLAHIRVLLVRMQPPWNRA